MERRLFNELSQFCFTYQEDDDVWIVGETCSLIFQVCINDCTIKRIIRIENVELMQTRQYCKLVKVQNKIVILPFGHNKTVIYDLEHDKFSIVYLSKDTSPEVSYVKEGQKLYLINNEEIVVLNVKDEKVEECVPIPYQDTIVSVMSFLVDGHILIPLVYQNQIIDFHIADKQFARLSLDCDANGFMAGVLDGVNLWLAGCNGNIVRWNYMSRQSALYNKLPEDFESFDYDKDGNFVTWGKGWRQGIYFKYYYDGLLVNDKVWFVPFLSNSLLYLDKKTDTIGKYLFENEKETDLTMKSHRFVKFIFVGVQEERYIKVYSEKRNVIYSIDTVTLKHTEEVFKFDNINTTDIEKEYWDALYNKASTECVLENRNISVKELVNLLGKNKKTVDIDTANGQTGAYIYRCMNFE